MSHALIPCAACGRHIRASEAACPFCDTASSIIDLGGPTRPPVRMGRAAMFAVGAAMLTMSACGDDGGDPDGGAQPLYGGPPVMDSGSGDAAIDASVEDATVMDSGGPVPAYGTPAPDSSVGDASPADAGGAALYGGPPMGDGGAS